MLKVTAPDGLLVHASLSDFAETAPRLSLKCGGFWRRSPVSTVLKCGSTSHLSSHARPTLPARLLVAILPIGGLGISHTVVSIFLTGTHGDILTARVGRLPTQTRRRGKFPQKVIQFSISQVIASTPSSTNKTGPSVPRWLSSSLTVGSSWTGSRYGEEIPV